MRMNKREKDIRQKLKADFLHYAEKCLKIRTKEGAIRRFVLNAAQKHIHAQLEAQLRETGRVRALILKGRQQGCSTYVEARFYWKVTHRKGAHAFILTHLDEATRHIYQIMRRFHEYCPLPVRPVASQANLRALVFGKLDSGYQIGTAKSQGVGRSNTLQYFHGSEVAFWSHAGEHMSGALQAVSDAPGTEIILESTSAGAAGLFHKLCADARQGKSDYQFIFIPWFWQDEYRRPAPADFIPDAEELDYMRRFNLDPEQICWRRAKIAETGSVWTFRREYPSTPEEAFHTDMPGALWTRDVIHRNRVAADSVPPFKRIVVAVDPAVTAHRHSDETGIIVAGLSEGGDGYVLADLSGRYAPATWAEVVIGAYYKYEADRVIAEANQGGDLVEHTLRAIDPNLSYKAVRASRGKVARAEPVAALDARGRIHHAGIFSALEDQMCRFCGSGTQSPDRADARVWAMTELMLNKPASEGPRLWSG